MPDRQHPRNAQSDSDLRWPRKAEISPTVLRQYESCPHRIRLRYIDKWPAPFVYSLFLDQGNIAHSLLAEIAHRRRAGSSQRSEDEMWTLAFRRLPMEEFPSREAHEAAADEIMRWVRYGNGYLDQNAEILVVEKPDRRLWTSPGGEVLSITTRPDAILLRADADGQRFVDIIDYKTGSKEYIDQIAPVTMRFVFKTLFQQISRETREFPMRFTYVWLAHRETHIIGLTPEYCDTAWENVNGVIDRLLTEREWKPQPSFLCRYCPYNGNACTAYEEWRKAGPNDSQDSGSA